MTRIFGFAGDGLAAGALTGSSAGTGDDTWTNVGSGWTIVNDGIRPPVMELNQGSGVAGLIYRTFASTTRARGRVYWRFKTASVSSGNHPILRVGAAAVRGFDLSWVATGRLRLLDSTNATVTDTPVSSIAGVTWFAIDYDVQPTTCTIRIYDAATNTLLYTLTGAGAGYGSTFDRISLGNPSTTPQAPVMQYDDVLLDDAAVPALVALASAGGEWQIGSIAM